MAITCSAPGLRASASSGEAGLGNPTAGAADVIEDGAAQTDAGQHIRQGSCCMATPWGVRTESADLRTSCATISGFLIKILRR